MMGLPSWEEETPASSHLLHCSPPCERTLKTVTANQQWPHPALELPAP